MHKVRNTLSKLFPWLPENSLLSEILQEAHDLTPEEFTWPNKPIAKGEILLDIEVTEYEKRLCTVSMRLANEIQYLDNTLQTEKEFKLTPSEREKIRSPLIIKRDVCNTLSLVNFQYIALREYPEIGFRIDHQVVAVSPAV